MDGDSLHRLREVFNILASDPWVREQTHVSLVKYLIEEAYELAEAIEHGDDSDLQEELGDVLIQVAIHAMLAERDGRFGWDQVADVAAEKMVRRHPHVFSEQRELTVDELHDQWQEIKKREKPERDSIFAGIPRELPALLQAQKIIARAHRSGYSFPVGGDVRGGDDHDEKSSLTTGGFSSEEALGEALFQLVAEAQAKGWDAERALRTKNWVAVREINLQQDSSSLPER